MRYLNPSNPIATSGRLSGNAECRRTNPPGDKIDSSANSGQAEDEAGDFQPRTPATPKEDQRRADMLFLVVDCTKPLLSRKCATKYRREMNVTIGGLLYDDAGNKSQDEGRVRLFG